MNLISSEDWLPCGDPIQTEREALEYAQLYGPEAVILHLLYSIKQSRVEFWQIHRVISILKPGEFELPPDPL